MAVKKKTKRFIYKPRSDEQLAKRRNQTSGAGAGFIKEGVKLFRPGPGTNKIRILPPTWQDADNYGVDVWAHYGVGPDRKTFLCLNKNPNLVEKEDQGTCPACAQRVKFQQSGMEESAHDLDVRKRVVVYLIDRAKPHDNVQAWAMPFTIDKEIAGLSYDEDTNEAWAPDDPEQGHDISFVKEGDQKSTKYNQVKVKPRETSLSDDPDEFDDWINYIQDNPIPDILVVHDAETIQQELDAGMNTKKSGKRKAKDDDDDEDEPPRRRRSRILDDEEEEEEAIRGRRRRAKDDDEDDEDDDEDEPPRRRGRAKAKDDDDDEDEEEQPRQRRSAQSARTSSRRAADEDDEDVEDDEEEAPARRRSSRAAATTKSRRAADDDDEDEEDDDEDDPLPPKSRAGSKLRGRTGRR